MGQGCDDVSAVETQVQQCADNVKLAMMVGIENKTHEEVAEFCENQ